MRAMYHSNLDSVTAVRYRLNLFQFFVITMLP